MPSILPHTVCKDEDDDKFISCAISTETSIIISGDKLLLHCSGYRNIEVISPKSFVDRYIKS